MLKKQLLTLAIVYTIALAIVSLIRLNEIPKLGVNHEDKIFHFLAYGLLMLLWFLAFNRINSSLPIIVIAISAIIYGIIIEVLQAELTSFRDYNVFDIIANALGVMVMTLIITLKSKTRVKKI